MELYDLPLKDGWLKLLHFFMDSSLACKLWNRSIVLYMNWLQVLASTELMVAAKNPRALLEVA